MDMKKASLNIRVDVVGQNPEKKENKDNQKTV